jgi:hypothetical protein
VKRPAIACLWVATIAATWLVVRRATEETAVAAKPTVARGGTARVTRALAVPAHDVPADPVALEALEDDTAFREVRATLERDLADGRWGPADRDRLTRGLREVTSAQASELYDVLFPKLNTGAVTSDLDGPPL